MSKNLLLLGVAGAIGVLYFLRKSTFARRSKIILRGIKLVGKNILQKKFQITFGVQNPTNNVSTINSITGDVFINGKKIADFSKFEKTRINANDETLMQIIAQPSAGILSLLLTKGWLKQGVVYDVKGTTNVDNLIVPFEFKQRLI